MKFAALPWLFGSLTALLVAALLIAGGIGLAKARARAGDEKLILGLRTFDSSRRRAVKGVLLVLGVALAFVALARPQYGTGQRLVPATNLDVVVVLDFSKSMYARDVLPSRISRAKAEVQRMTRELSGARFAAVAFAGEPMGFPLTADGAAIAQFLKQTDPNDMPVGGTAIARALEKAREILQRDPKSKDHKRVIVLVTDGEDLEGDPVQTAKNCQTEGIMVNVVQIGGRSPERIPEVGPDGRVLGWRMDEFGKPLTTQLSVEGEAQLAQIAEVSGGKLVRSDKGNTGIEEMTQLLKKMMTQELSERYEVVYADQYMWPLGIAVLFLLVEALLPEAPFRRLQPVPTEPTTSKRLMRKGRASSGVERGRDHVA